MSGRRSRIAHPPGSRYIRIDLWVTEALGDSCSAACLAVLEFIDRRKDEEGEWLGCNAVYVQKMLAGLFGRDKVRAGIDLLVKKGWVEEKEESLLVGQLWTRRRDLRLRPDIINRFIRENSNNLKICEFQAQGTPEIRQSEALKAGVNYKACKPKAAAEEKYAAAHQGKRRRPRPSGIVCFYDDDNGAAERIEATYSAEDISIACRDIISTLHEPVPGVVEKAIQDRLARNVGDAKQQERIQDLTHLPPNSHGKNIKKIWNDIRRSNSE